MEEMKLKGALILQVLALLFDTVSSHYRMTVLHQKLCQSMKLTLDRLQVNHTTFMSI